MRRILLFVVCAAALLAGDADAQSVDAPAFWDALTDAPDVSAVHALPRPAAATTAETELIDGMIGLRTYELTLDRTDGLVATRALERAVRLSREDAWASFMLGVMLARGPDVRGREYAEKFAYQPRPNSNAAINAQRALRRALELDPSLDEAAYEFASLAADLSDPELMKEAVGLLDSGSRAQNGYALVLAARLHTRLEEYETAAALARNAIDRGYDRSIAQLERAIALSVLPGTGEQAAAAYFDGLDHLTHAGAEAYFASMALLVNADEEKTWFATPLTGKKDWLRRFWDRYAALAGLSPERRIAEHFRRVDAHRGPFLNPILTARPQDTIPPAPNILNVLFPGNPSLLEVNPEYVATLRHGDPTRPKRFIFCAPGWEKLPVPLQPTLAECMQSPFGRMRAKHMNRIYAWQGTERAIEGQSYYPDYKEYIALTWEALQFRASGGGAEVFAAVGVPGGSAVALLNQAGEMEPVITLTLVDTIQDWIRRGRTSARLSVTGLEREHLLLFQVGTTAPAGDSVELRIAVENTTATAGTIVSGRMNVGAFHPDSLGISSIVLSPPDARGTFQRGAVRVALAPGRVFGDETPTLYYEVYGAPAGVTLQTEIRIEPIRDSLTDQLRSALGRGDGSISFRFSEPAGAPLPVFGLQQTRTIGLDALPTGAYRLRVTITEVETGRSASRETTLEVEKPEG